MRFHANYVSTSADGDYYGAIFERDDDSDAPDAPYLIIQRQFEDPDPRCYVETRDLAYCGHFLLRRIEFTPHSLLVELNRPKNNLICVTLRMTPVEFAAASRVMKIISGEIGPDRE